MVGFVVEFGKLKYDKLVLISHFPLPSLSNCVCVCVPIA